MTTVRLSKPDQTLPPFPRF